MKQITSAISLLVVVLAPAASWAGESRSLLDLPFGSGISIEEEIPVPLAPHSRIFSNFRSRLAAAIKSGDVPAMRTLYKTNGIAAEEMKLELARWRPILGDESKARVSMWFKELASLPATARHVWGERARSLTTHEVTHLAFLQREGTVRLMLLLVFVEGRLLIVPSDQVKL